MINQTEILKVVHTVANKPAALLPGSPRKNLPAS